MTDPEILTGAGALVGGGGLVAFARWAIGVWRDVRRESTTAAKDAAVLERADSARMVEALLEQARSNATLAGEFKQLAGEFRQLAVKLDLLVEWRERTPVEMAAVDPDGFDAERPPSSPRRIRTAPRGFRSPTRGEHHDDLNDITDDERIRR